MIMKALIKSICSVIAVLSLFAFLYGTMKLARASQVYPTQNIDPGIPGAIVEQSSPLDQNNAQAIITTSILVLGLSAAGFAIAPQIEAKFNESRSPEE
jgi:hypothetical protein